MCSALALPVAHGWCSLDISEAQSGSAGLSAEVDESRYARLEREFSAVCAQNEVFARQLDALRLRLEAVGLDAGASASAAVEQRLLSAVSDLRQSEAQRRRLGEALDRLVGAVALFRSSVVSDPEEALVLDNEVRTARRALGSEQSASGTDAAMGPVVLSANRQLGVFLASLGSDQQVRVGAPFRVERAGELVALARVVDIRSRVCAMAVESLADAAQFARKGDSLRLNTRRD